MVKKKEKRLNKEGVAQIFILLGFFVATLTQEVMNIVHDFAKSHSEGFYLIYAIIIVFILWPLLMHKILKAIEYVHAEK